MNKFLILLIMVSTNVIARPGEVSLLKQADYPDTEPPVQLSPEYVIFSNKGSEGKPFFMQCTNGSADDCNFNVNSLCTKGTAVGADPFGKPQTGRHAKAPAYMTYPGVGRVSIFMCVDEENTYQ